MPKTKNAPEILYVVAFGNVNEGWRFAPVDTNGDRGEASKPYGSRPDALTAAEEAHPGVVIRLSE